MFILAREDEACLKCVSVCFVGLGYGQILRDDISIGKRKRRSIRKE